jgi:rubrerythrin
VYRFGLLEDFDHMYRYAALMDRVEGKDANTLVQSYSDLLPGRPTSLEHRDPSDDLRTPYDRTQAALLTKLHALTIMAGEHQTHDYYMTIGPMFADPIARQLYAEIASIEEQHVTQYESIIDANETWLEKWLLHEATEVYNYFSCVEYENNPRIKGIWERFLEYELGHLRFVADLFENTEKRDAAEVLSASLPKPIRYDSHREFVRQVLRTEVHLSAAGSEFVDRSQETERTRDYRTHMNSEGSPSDTVAAGYIWTPGTELAAPAQSRR